MKELNHYRFPNAGGSKAKYDWDTILNGKTWRLTQGEDYKPEPRTFVAHVHGTAKRKGLKVHTHIDGNSIVVRAYKEQAEKKAVAKAKEKAPKIVRAVQPAEIVAEPVVDAKFVATELPINA